MKKALLTLIALSVSVSVFAQGTVVFSNVGALKNVMFDENNDGVGDRNLAVGDGVQVSLWFAAADTADPNAAAWQMLGAPAPLIAAGLFSGGNRTVPNAANGDTFYAFQVRAWETATYGTTSDSWAAAKGTLNAKVMTHSPIINSKTGGWGDPIPSVAVNLAPIFKTATDGFVVGTVVPEPSVFALGVLGVGALLLLRRRK